MEKRRLNSLRLNLMSLQSEADDAEIKSIISKVLNYLDNDVQTKRVDDENNRVNILAVIEIIDNKGISKLKELYPKLNIYKYIENSEMLAGLSLSEISTFTVNELKILYYLLTGTKNNNAMKTRNKEVVVNSVKEAISQYKRSEKLLLLQ